MGYQKSNIFTDIGELKESMVWIERLLWIDTSAVGILVLINAPQILSMIHLMI